MHNENDAMKDDADNSPALISSLRWMSNMACLWALCRNQACGRARQCRRDPRSCMHRYGPLVPDDVREGVGLMFDGKQHGVGYDDLRAQSPFEIAAVEDWVARVEASARSAAAT